MVTSSEAYQVCQETIWWAPGSVHRGGWVGGLFCLLSSGVTYLSILYMGVSVSELTRALYISAMLGPLRVLLLLRSQHLSGGKLSLIFRCSLATPNSLLIPSHRWIILLHVRNPFCLLHGIMKRPLPFFFKEFIKSSRELSVCGFRLRIKLKYQVRAILDRSIVRILEGKNKINLKPKRQLTEIR